MSCDVGEATKESLQHEILRIGTFILVINYFLYQKLFSICFLPRNNETPWRTIRRTVRLVTPHCRRVDIPDDITCKNLKNNFNSL